MAAGTFGAMADEALAALAVRQPEAFDELVRRYQAKLLRYIRRLMLLNTQEAEDLLQDVFLSAYVNIVDFDPELKFSAWIYRIAHNRVISEFRKVSVRPTVSFEVEQDAVLRIASDVNLPVDMDRKILQKRIRDGLRKLPLKYREVLELYYFEGLAVQEISDVLRKPIGTIGTLMRRGKQAFCEIIDCRTLSLL